MTSETPMELIRQLQISLRREAKLSSYDPGDSSIPGLPSAACVISELDSSQPYLRCKNCKGRLLRGVQSRICVFCGKQQTTSNNPPDPIRFTSTFGYKWLLSSLHLNGSEMVEPISDGEKSDELRKASAEKVILSSLLGYEIRWHLVEEERGTTLDEKSAQTKVLLNLAGVDIENYFTDGKEEAEVTDYLSNRTLENAINKDFVDHANLSLFENTGSKGESPSQYSETRSSLQSGDAFQSNFLMGQSNLSLFEHTQPSEVSADSLEIQRTSSSEGHNVLSFFDSTQLSKASVNLGDAQGSSSSKDNNTLDLFVKTQPSEPSLDFVGAPGNSFPKLHDNLDFFENDKNTDYLGLASSGDAQGDISSEAKKAFNSSVPETLFELPVLHDSSMASSDQLSAHMDTIFGSGDGFAAPRKNSSNWFQDDLQNNVAQQTEKKDVTVNNDSTQSNATSFDWTLDNLWQSSTNNRTSGTNVLGQAGGWDEFTGPVHVERNTPKNIKDSSTMNMDWMQGDNAEPSSCEDHQEDAPFQPWRNFAGAIMKTPAATHPEQSVHHASNEDVSVKVKDGNLDASTLNSDGGRDGSHMEGIIQKDLPGGIVGVKSDDVEKVMSQMHDLSFMLENKLSLPPKAEGSEHFP